MRASLRQKTASPTSWRAPGSIRSTSQPPLDALAKPKNESSERGTVKSRRVESSLATGPAPAKAATSPPARNEVREEGERVGHADLGEVALHAGLGEAPGEQRQIRPVRAD